MATLAFHLFRRSLTKSFVLLFVAVVYLLHVCSNALPSVSFAPFGRKALLQPNVYVPTALGAGSKNLVAMNEGVSRGPWVIDTPLPSTLTTTEPITLTFRCLWNPADMCPTRYIVVLRGPTMYSPPLTNIVQDSTNPALVNVTLHVHEPGEYDLHAWPDFQECPKYWQQNMKYPINRGQVVGTPRQVKVKGQSVMPEAYGACPAPRSAGSLSMPDDSRPEGRWVSKHHLAEKYATSSWAQSFQHYKGPEWMGQSEYVYQPYACKRPRYELSEVARSPDVKHILFLGDSVLRGSFCSQIWPSFSSSGTADGACTFINDRDLYHIAPKSLEYRNSTSSVDLTFRFMDDQPIARLDTVPSTLTTMPTHIVANLGLWMAIYTAEEYRSVVEVFLLRAVELFPDATIIWRTTTDVAPMITCFSDKGMTRAMIAAQRQASLDVIEQLRREMGLKIHIVDAYGITMSRPDAANDGRHWVIESPEENGWMRPQRPVVGDAERAVVDAIWEIMMYGSGEPATPAAVPSASAKR